MTLTENGSQHTLLSPGASDASARNDASAHDASAATPIQARELQVDLGGRRVLDGVDITVRARTVHVLLGPNGAGKTTLLRSLLGLQPLRQGQVQIQGRLGYVPQRSEMDWDFPVTAQEVVMLGLVRRISRWRGPHRAHVEAVARALRTVRLADLRDRPISEMSGGQRQRVLIARALAQDPSVLVLDEPFTGLDMPSQELLTDLFRDLARQGHAVLMSTHDLGQALEAADHVTLLRRRVIADGPPANLRDAQPWMEAFDVSATSPLLRQVGALTGEER